MQDRDDMSDFVPTTEDSKFLKGLSDHVRTNPDVYQDAGRWLDKEFSAAACWRRKKRKAKQSQRGPKERRIIESPMNRICVAVRNLMGKDAAFVTVPTWDEGPGFSFSAGS